MSGDRQQYIQQFFAVTSNRKEDDGKNNKK
jgi:hypothetical protein